MFMRIVKTVSMLVVLSVAGLLGMMATQFKVVNDLPCYQKMQKSLHTCPQFKNMLVAPVPAVEVKVKEEGKKCCDQDKEVKLSRVNVPAVKCGCDNECECCAACLGHSNKK
jgi:hypothetical protein